MNGSSGYFRGNDLRSVNTCKWNRIVIRLHLDDFPRQMQCWPCRVCWKWSLWYQIMFSHQTIMLNWVRSIRRKYREEKLPENLNEFVILHAVVAKSPYQLQVREMWYGLVARMQTVCIAFTGRLHWRNSTPQHEILETPATIPQFTFDQSLSGWFVKALNCSQVASLD